MNQNHTNILTGITGLGDALVLGVLMLVLSVYLVLHGYKREPLAMVAAFILPASIIGMLKIAFYTCDTHLWGIVSPSGHSAISTGVLGVSALIIAKFFTGLWRKIVPLVLVLLAAIIAISRTILGMHTDSDVVFGSLIGLAVVFAVSKFVLNNKKIETAEDEQRHKNVHPAIICGLVIVVLGIFYGIRLPSEQAMSWVARQIRLNSTVCSTP